MAFAKGHKGLRKHYTQKVENICVVCGTREMRRPCEVSAFCSAACYHASRRGVRPKEVERECESCGQTFRNYESQIGRYCSRPCADAAKIQDVRDRLWKRVNVGTATTCWNWTGAVGTDGYGKFWYKGSSTHAHRAAYELAHGEIAAKGLVVCHTCDNPLCCNPSHLFVGTPKDNTADMIAKGRAARRNIVRVTLKCGRCGKHFDVIPNRAQVRRYCSPRCSALARWHKDAH